MSFTEAIISRVNFWTFVVLLMIGLYAMMVKKNLIKKLIGMSIFQSAIILFFVSISVKRDASIPILDHQTLHEMDLSSEVVIDPAKYTNPLPHVLMLTAIVVSVSTLGVGLAVSQKIYQSFGTLEEDKILDQIRSAHG